MIVGVDTDVLAHWLMAGASRHHAARAFLAREVEQGNQLGLTQQVIAELVHVITDGRRFERPLTMQAAIDAARHVWTAPEVVRIVPAPGALERALDLLKSYRLGRKRILDTMLAAILEAAGVTRLATFNGDDFRVFGFLEIDEPA